MICSACSPSTMSQQFKSITVPTRQLMYRIEGVMATTRLSKDSTILISMTRKSKFSPQWSLSFKTKKKMEEYLGRNKMALNIPNLVRMMIMWPPYLTWTIWRTFMIQMRLLTGMMSSRFVTISWAPKASPVPFAWKNSMKWSVHEWQNAVISIAGLACWVILIMRKSGISKSALFAATQFTHVISKMWKSVKTSCIKQEIKCHSISW